MKYSQIITFTKFTNLMPYAEAEASRTNVSIDKLPHVKAYYEKNRDITLNVYVGRDMDKLYCKIQCPISPLPVKGEFEVPSLYILREFLKNNGWKEINCVLIPRNIRNSLT
jgi:hypothetical protein